MKTIVSKESKYSPNLWRYGGYKEVKALAKLKYHGENCFELENEKEYLCIDYLLDQLSFIVVSDNLTQREYSMLVPGFEYGSPEGGIWEITDIYELSFLEMLKDNEIEIPGYSKFVENKQKIEKPFSDEGLFEFDLLPSGSIISAIYKGTPKSIIVGTHPDALINNEFVYDIVKEEWYDEGNYDKDAITHCNIQDIEYIYNVGKIDKTNIKDLQYPEAFVKHLDKLQEQINFQIKR